MKRRVKRHAVVQPQDQSIRLIPLTKGQNAIVDAADYEWLSQWNWYAKWSKCTQGFYAQRHVSGSSLILWMHRELLHLKAEDHREGDHHNHNGLDNRRANLRIATPAQNRQNAKTRRDNKAGEKGVYFNHKLKKWMIHIQANGRRKYLGLALTLKEASAIRRAAEKKYHGEFANSGHLPANVQKSGSGG